LKGISKKYQRTAAQVILRWYLQKGIIPIPKTSHKERVVENYQIFDFNINQADLILIDNFNRDLRFGPHPDSFQEFFGS
jgi:methylglyoxal/glyoxal reductase